MLFYQELLCLPGMPNTSDFFIIIMHNDTILARKTARRIWLQRSQLCKFEYLFFRLDIISNRVCRVLCMIVIKIVILFWLGRCVQSNSNIHICTSLYKFRLFLGIIIFQKMNQHGVTRVTVTLAITDQFIWLYNSCISNELYRCKRYFLPGTRYKRITVIRVIPCWFNVQNDYSL